MPPETVRDLRRGQIVAAARAIVAEQGVEALTIGALEQRLSFSRGVISYHFDGKDDLERAVLESVVADIDAMVRAEVAAASTPEERVRAILRGNVRGFVERVEAGRVLLSYWGRIGRDERVRRGNAALYQRYRGAARRVLEDGVRAGAFVAHDSEVVAGLLVGAVIGIATQAYFDPGAVDVEELVEESSRTFLARLTFGSGEASRVENPRPRRRRA